MNKKKKVIIISAIATIIVVANIILITITFHNKSVKNNKSNSSITEKEKPKIEEEKPKEEVIYNSPVPGLKEYYHNDDIVAELEIPSLDLKEAVAKTSDNDYYLSHDLLKEEKVIGATFTDYRIQDLNTAKQINIYGHNAVSYDVPFKKLENYQDEEFFYNNLDIILRTDKQEFRYLIFAVKAIQLGEDEHMIISRTGQRFLDHVNILRTNTIHDTNIEITADDDLLVLQTCLYNPGNRKLLVIAKKLK